MLAAFCISEYLCIILYSWGPDTSLHMYASIYRDLRLEANLTMLILGSYWFGADQRWPPLSGNSDSPCYWFPPPSYPPSSLWINYQAFWFQYYANLTMQRLMSMSHVIRKQRSFVIDQIISPPPAYSSFQSMDQLFSRINSCTHA